MLLLALIISLMMSRTRCHSIFLEPQQQANHCIGMVKPHCKIDYGTDELWNYNHNELWCGGRLVQNNKVNDGRCGICGDPFTGEQPNQAGGK